MSYILLALDGDSWVYQRQDNQIPKEPYALSTGEAMPKSIRQLDLFEVDNIDIGSLHTGDKILDIDLRETSNVRPVRGIQNQKRKSKWHV